MIFWVEVSTCIGMGHLIESVVLAEVLKSVSSKVNFLITPFKPAEEYLRQKGFTFHTAPLLEGLTALDDIVDCVVPKLIVVNHRNVRLSHLMHLKDRFHRVSVIDQLGNKPIVCDLLINHSIVEHWHCYEFPLGAPRRCFGPKYALLGPEFSTSTKVGKDRSSSQIKVLVSMGGVDNSGSTLKVIEGLSYLLPSVRKEIVLGFGFDHHKKLQVISQNVDESFSFVAGVQDMAKRISRADIVISSGGNTVYECLRVGTPVAIIWEDDHEGSLAEALMDRGCAYNIGPSASTEPVKISKMFKELMSDDGMLMKLRESGMMLVDGLGASRIYDEILNLEKG